MLGRGGSWSRGPWAAQYRGLSIMGGITKSGGSEGQGSVYVYPSWEMPGSHTEPHRDLVTVAVHCAKLH